MMPLLRVPSVSTTPGLMNIDPDLLRAEFAGEHSGDGVDRALGAGVKFPTRTYETIGLPRRSAETTGGMETLSSEESSANCAGDSDVI